MFHFLKINPQTLYAHLTKEELVALGIDIEKETDQTKERLMSLVSSSLEHHPNFDLKEPLSIQVATTKEGVQIVVNCASLKMHMSPQLTDTPFAELDALIQELLDDPISTAYVVVFNDFEDLLSLVRQHVTRLTKATKAHLYVYEGKYTLHLECAEANNQYHLQNVLSLIKEYATLSNLTTALLQEYGTLVIQHNAFDVLYRYFFAKNEKSND